MTGELKEQVARAARELKQAGAGEVYVFGSAATGVLRPGSDIDMAVAGLPASVFFHAMSRAGDVLDRNLDLVDLDEDTPFVRYLKTHGELQRVA